MVTSSASSLQCTVFFFLICCNCAISPLGDKKSSSHRRKLSLLCAPVCFRHYYHSHNWGAVKVHQYIFKLDRNCHLSTISRCGCFDSLSVGFKCEWTDNFMFFVLQKKEICFYSISWVYDFFFKSINTLLIVRESFYYARNALTGGNCAFICWQCLSLSNWLHKGMQTICWSAAVCMRPLCTEGVPILC